MVRIPVLSRPLPPGDPRVHLAREALSRPDDAPAHVVVAGTAEHRLQAGSLPDIDLGRVDAAFLAEPGVAWVGGHGVAVLPRGGRPVLVTYARLRRADGAAWCRVWPRLPGIPADPHGGQDLAGPRHTLPDWVDPLFPTLVPGSVQLVRGAPPAAPPADPPGPDQVLSLPAGATFPDAVQAAAHALEARFVTQGRADPTLVAWRGEGIEGWTGEGREAAARLHVWGRRLAGDPGIRALGLFGLGEDEVDGRRVPMIALAMQARDGGSVLWLRRFQRVEGGRARWLDKAGLVRAPGPSLGWFGEGR